MFKELPEMEKKSLLLEIETEVTENTQNQYNAKLKALLAEREVEKQRLISEVKDLTPNQNDLLKEKIDKQDTYDLFDRCIQLGMLGATVIGLGFTIKTYLLDTEARGEVKKSPELLPEDEKMRENPSSQHSERQEKDQGLHLPQETSPTSPQPPSPQRLTAEGKTFPLNLQKGAQTGVFQDFHLARLISRLLPHLNLAPRRSGNIIKLREKSSISHLLNQSSKVDGEIPFKNNYKVKIKL